MISTFCKTLQLRGKLNVHSCISTFKFHSSRVSYDVRQPLSSLTEVEEMKIVEIVNKSSIEEFAKYNIKPTQLKKLLTYRDKNDKFKTFNDLLMNQDVPSLMRLCKSILAGEKTPRKNKSSDATKSLTTPAIDQLAKINIRKILGLHVWGNRLCWAMIDENNVLSNWDSRTFENPSKTTLLPLINILIEIISELPQADAYVMESESYTSLSRLKTAMYALHLQRQQILAIIISVLQTKHRLKDSKNETVDNFYMLQCHAAAKRYNLRVGTETVSAEAFINDILSGTPNSNSKLSISVKPEINLQYVSTEKSIRVHLHSVLLVTMAFSDLIHNKKLIDT